MIRFTIPRFISMKFKKKIESIRFPYLYMIELTKKALYFIFIKYLHFHVSVCNNVANRFFNEYIIYISLITILISNLTVAENN